MNVYFDLEKKNVEIMKTGKGKIMLFQATTQIKAASFSVFYASSFASYFVFKNETLNVKN